ncbi:MAG: sodium-translocating pyrophosphatase [Nitrososphaerota archaeon]
MPILVSLLAIFYSCFLILSIFKNKIDNEEVKKISNAIQEGAKAYLFSQYKVIFIIAIILAILIYLAFGYKTAIGFLIGGFFSALAGAIGMLVATKSNGICAIYAKYGKSKAFSIAAKSGQVTGLLVNALALLSITLFYFLTKDLQPLIGLAFGSSLISIFARLGGGIYTKAADVGADLVGKIEANIPEDDPRNPAVIADNVGDNVGDDAGMAADLFETYVVTLTSAMILGNLLLKSEVFVLLPLALGGLATLASIISTLFIRISEKTKNLMMGFYRGLIVNCILSILGFYYFLKSRGFSDFNKLFLSSLIGIAITWLIFIITDYYTSKKYRPVLSIAKSSLSGHATNIITGLSFSMESTALPVIVISLGIIIAYTINGLYGIALATFSMLSMMGIIISIDAFGPVADNAAGISEMANLEEGVRNNLDPLDAIGNTTKAITKGYAIGSAGLGALVLFSAYLQELPKNIDINQFSLNNPYLLVGLFLGAILPYYFASKALLGVGNAAQSVVKEVRRQFKEIEGLIEGKAKPDYGKCVEIVTKAAQKEMIIPSLLPVIVPILIGIILGPIALGGALIGSIITGLFVAISMTSGGAAWDNAKKYIEEGNYGGKGSEAHKASVTGDTVGDPYKDTAGPAINPLIKITNIVALLIVKFLK